MYVVQTMPRAAFANNNIDTCARVCHSQAGYGLRQTFGESAGMQDFRSVAKSDVILVIGATPTDGTRCSPPGCRVQKCLGYMGLPTPTVIAGP
ncbi:MAG: hypothetical protein PHQ28_12505 [Mycobacterium sp.]|nr:hypothetical protein [Mycobacterium sp.]